MSYVRTMSVVDDLAAWLTLWRWPEADEAFFERVAVYDAPDLVKALNDLLVFGEDKVALLVPLNHRYIGSLLQGVTTRRKVISVMAIYAVRDYDVSTVAAQIATVSDLADYIEADLTTATWSLSGVRLVPVEGAPEDIRHPDRQSQTMWRAWTARYESWAGIAEYDTEADFQ